MVKEGELYMARDPEYQQFLDVMRGAKDDEIRGDEEVTEATAQEFGWRMQHQVQRAIHAVRYGTATPEQLQFLDERNKDKPPHKQIVIPPQARQRARKKNQ